MVHEMTISLCHQLKELFCISSKTLEDMRCGHLHRLHHAIAAYQYVSEPMSGLVLSLMRRCTSANSHT